MNSKIIGIVILVVAIGGASAYFLSKSDTIDSVSENEFVTQNEKIGLVINSISPPKNIIELENQEITDQLNKTCERFGSTYKNHTIEISGTCSSCN